MADRPILFSSAMVLAILAGRKTQTRRLITPATSIVGTGARWDRLDWSGPVRPDRWTEEGAMHLHVPHHGADGVISRVYPRITPGDRLWVRETWRRVPPGGGIASSVGHQAIHYRADDTARYRPVPPDFALDAWLAVQRRRTGEWRPSIYMPAWASRLTLLVESVRVERLQEITEEDAAAEGVEPSRHIATARQWGGPHRLAFSRLWEKINGKRASWASNPWVWIVSFRRVEP